MLSRAIGQNPAGEDLRIISDSGHYRDGAFHNLKPTEITLKEASFFKMLYDFINKPASASPPISLPGIKTDLRSLNSEEPVLIWFGHSSYLISYQGTTILVDPVLSGNASPVSFFAKSFAGTDIYSAEDFPHIDAMILTHDHYDHLDYKTIRELHPKTTHYYVPLGVASHLKFWGIEAEKITSLNWWDSASIPGGFNLTATPARHFSGRGLRRNQTLWTSYVLRMDPFSIFIGGDSGYDTHFREIGENFGPFDLAILESGQYNPMWPYIHLSPEESVRASMDLKTELLLPVHWGKFALAYHNWDEPVQRVLMAAKELNLKVTTPMIGEKLILGSVHPDKEWWILD